jgi:hypothetical protein
VQNPDSIRKSIQSHDQTSHCKQTGDEDDSFDDQKCISFVLTFQAELYAKRLDDKVFQVISTLNIAGAPKKIQGRVQSANLNLDRLAKELEKSLDKCRETPESKVYDGVMSRIQRQLLSQGIKPEDVGIVGREMISDRMHSSTSNEASTRFRILISRVNWLKG